MKKTFRFIHYFVLVSMFGTFLNAFIPPSRFPYINYLALPFPFLFGLHVLLTLMWMYKKDRIINWLIIPTILLLFPLRGWINFSFPLKEKDTFKVVTFNVNSGVGTEPQIQEYIKNLQPDLVYFQESRFYKSPHLALENLNFTSKCYLTQMYSKTPILEEGAIFDTSKHWGQSHYMDVEINGKRIRCINVYLESFQLSEISNHPWRILSSFNTTFSIHEEQIKAIEKAIKKSPYPVLLAGDFNAVPNSYEYERLTKLVKDSYLKGGNGRSTTFSIAKIPLRIDYIFSSPAIKCVSYKVDHSVHLSDHQPVIAEFIID